MENKQIKTIESAIKEFGNITSLIVTTEECSELIKAIMKLMRYSPEADSKEYKEMVNNILEESADVYIMLHHIWLLFGDPIPFITNKINRLNKRVNNKRKENALKENNK